MLNSLGLETGSNHTRISRSVEGAHSTPKPFRIGSKGRATATHISQFAKFRCFHMPAEKQLEIIHSRTLNDHRPNNPNFRSIFNYSIEREVLVRAFPGVRAKPASSGPCAPLEPLTNKYIIIIIEVGRSFFQLFTSIRKGPSPLLLL